LRIGIAVHSRLFTAPLQFLNGTEMKKTISEKGSRGRASDRQTGAVTRAVGGWVMGASPWRKSPRYRMIFDRHMKAHCIDFAKCNAAFLLMPYWEDGRMITNMSFRSTAARSLRLHKSATCHLFRQIRSPSLRIRQANKQFGPANCHSNTTYL
jgi:hypothetical protein